MTVFTPSREISGDIPWPTRPHVSLVAVAVVTSSVFLLLLADALMNARAFFDVAALKQVQRVDGPFVGEAFEAVNALTSSYGAAAAWLATLGFVVYRRWWVAAIAVAVLPVGGAVNYAVGEIVGRTRPEGDEFVRTVGTAATSFPSGHVMGAVLLYGLIFAFAGKVDDRRIRFAMRAGSAGIVATVGAARLWEGAHWPSDVLAAYSLGGLMLAGILAAYYRADQAIGGLPLIHQGWMPHDATTKHTHALTSIVMFRENTVSKTYTPGFLPRLLYWTAFQAPFPYVANVTALRAAAARRNLAAGLTEYWYGERRVALALRVEEVNGRQALTSEYIRGHEPHDRKAAKAFLRDLCRRFESTGFPTWQIDPRQPRAVDNVLETDGGYMIVDLESGLVSPLASFKSWGRAIRRGMAPLFDSVYFDITRAYVTAEESAIRTRLGDARYEELVRTLNDAEALQTAWHASEPRIISRFIGGFWSGWNYRAWPDRIARTTAHGQARAAERLHHAVDRWAEESRITPGEAGELHRQVESSEIRAAMPHLGAHAAITLALRFPFGSVARMGWTLGALVVDTGRLAARRISFAQWKRSWSMHSPLVFVLSAIPGFGAMAYLAAKPVRKNRLLVRAVVDMLMLKVPGRLYERCGLRRLVARPADVAAAAALSERTDPLRADHVAAESAEGALAA